MALSPLGDPILWLSLLVAELAALVWARLVDVELGGLGILGAAVGLLAVKAAYRRFRPDAEAIAIMIETAAAFIAFTAVWAPITYLAARTDRPLVDAALAQADLFLGFDWEGWARGVAALPVLDAALRLSYGTLMLQAAVALVVLPLVKGRRRGYELVRQAVVSIAITCVLFGLFPAMGAVAGDWTSDLAALRAPEPFVLVLHDSKGLISFPSYHTVLGVLYVYAFRGTRLQIPAFLLNVLMILSTLNVGKHYLVDVLGGIAVAGLAIGLTEGLDALWPVRSQGPA